MAHSFVSGLILITLAGAVLSCGRYYLHYKKQKIMKLEKGLGELKKYLPHGYADLFAKQHKCSTSKVYKVVSGRLVDFRLLNALKELAMENLSVEQQITKTNKKIAQ